MSQLILDFSLSKIVGWMDCKKISRAGVKIGKLFGSAGWQDFSDDHVPKPHNRVFDAGTINSFDYQSGRPSSLCWPLHKIHERKTSGEIFFYLFKIFSGPPIVHSFLKQCCARSSFYENMVLHLMSAEEGFLKVHCFYKIKIAQILF